jgi:hypothetical protein
MTKPDGLQPLQKPARQRGRGWLLSLAAIVIWEAALVIASSIAKGFPSGDVWFWTLGPALFSMLVFGTPLTYLVAWRRPKSYFGVLLAAMPVFVVVFFIVFGRR